MGCSKRFVCNKKLEISSRSTCTCTCSVVLLSSCHTSGRGLDEEELKTCSVSFHPVLVETAHSLERWFRYESCLKTISQTFFPQEEPREALLLSHPSPRHSPACSAPLCFFTSDEKVSDQNPAPDPFQCVCRVIPQINLTLIQLPLNVSAVKSIRHI